MGLPSVLHLLCLGQSVPHTPSHPVLRDAPGSRAGTDNEAMFPLVASLLCAYGAVGGLPSVVEFRTSERFVVLLFFWGGEVFIFISSRPTPICGGPTHPRIGHGDDLRGQHRGLARGSRQPLVSLPLLSPQPCPAINKTTTPDNHPLTTTPDNHPAVLGLTIAHRGGSQSHDPGDGRDCFLINLDLGGSPGAITQVTNGFPLLRGASSICEGSHVGLIASLW